jgi:hypothetical protein
MDKHASVHISCYTEREGPRGFSFFAGACLAPSSAAAAMREPRVDADCAACMLLGYTETFCFFELIIFFYENKKGVGEINWEVGRSSGYKSGSSTQSSISV